MPLSKARNRDRMREIRLHSKITTAPVQPEELIDTPELDDMPSNIEYIDADGNPVYE